MPVNREAAAVNPDVAPGAVAGAGTAFRKRHFPRPAQKWSVPFLGMSLYMAVEYLRLPAAYPILQPLQLGKVAIVVAAVGFLFAPSLLSLPRSGMRTFSDALMVALVAVTAVGSLFAYTPSLARECTLLAVIWLVVYFVLSRAISNSWGIRAMTVVWLLVNFKLAQFAVRSFGYNLKYSGYSEMTVVTYGVGGGSTGWMGNSADFGVGMCVVWPVASYLVLARITTWKRWVLLLCSGTYLAAILLCGSRGAIVGAVGVAVMALLRSPKKVPALLMILLLLPGLYFIVPEASKERFRRAFDDPHKDKTAGHRLIMWAAGERMFLDHPLLGVGPACFGTAYRDQYGGNRGIWVPHSLYIEAISERGVIGTLPFLLIFVQIFRTNAATRRRLREVLRKDAPRSFEFCLSVGLELGFVGYLVSGAFVAVLMYPHTFLILGLSTALHATALAMPAPAKEQESSPARARELGLFTPASVAR